ncbi:MAG TPA: diguanylate cyclase [Terriglobales bacterium]|nr:diguanylate cyclase [Terriglobales bacterium]
MDTSSPELKILVADDSPVYRKLVEQSLSQEHCAVLLAKNGRQAIDLFAEHQPGVVITDWTMPDISGIELCQRIRREFAQSYAYVILLTGNTDKEKVIEGLASGADDYVTKPFHPGELQARVKVGRRMVEMHRQVQDKNRQLEEMALTDPLTGLPNRRAIDVWAIRQLSAAARHDFSIWVAMADLDHFKIINDTYGHDAGDTVLKGFAEVLRSSTRQSNICGRVGGEEFLVVITHAEKEDVTIAIERIRKHFETRKFTVAGKTFGNTASFGIAGFCRMASPNFSDLVTRADAALYSAKQKGRNRIEFAMS